MDKTSESSVQTLSSSEMISSFGFEFGNDYGQIFSEWYDKVDRETFNAKVREFIKLFKIWANVDR